MEETTIFDGLSMNFQLTYCFFKDNNDDGANEYQQIKKEENGGLYIVVCSVTTDIN